MTKRSPRNKEIFTLLKVVGERARSPTTFVMITNQKCQLYRDFQNVFYRYPTLIMKKKDYSYAGLMLLVEVRVPVLLKVKAYTRVRFGKTEKVSSYYRRIGVRK